MNKASHKRKIKLARKLRSPLEMSKSMAYFDKQGKPVERTYKNIFDTTAWLTRKEQIKQRVIRDQKAAHERAVARRAQRLAKV